MRDQLHPFLCRTLTTLFVVVGVNGTLPAQEKTPKPALTRMLFVMDASNSMNAFWGNQPKINTARELLLKSLKELEGQPDLEIGLRLYGHQTAIVPGHQDCDDTKLEVPLSTNSIPDIRNVLNSVRCQGTTPIARSLEKSGDDFPTKGSDGDRNVRNIIILITDGIEACDEDPCAVSRALQAKGITLKPFVIGVGLIDADKYSLQCVGNFYDASTPELFDQVLKVVVTQALNNTTAQVSLMTEDGQPTETNVPVTFYDQITGAVRYHFVHTMNDRNIPDTLSIDPIYTYRVVAHTVPRTVRTDVKLKPGIHNIIAVDAGLGTLQLKLGSGPPDAQAIPCIIRRKGELRTMHVQDLGSNQRLKTGVYDLEVLTLPRLLINDVTIQQGKTTDIVVPRPGTLNIQPSASGPGAVFVKRGDELEWVADLDPLSLRTQLRLLPGSYQVMYRSGYAHRTELSLTKDVTIESGKSVTINF